MQAKGPEFTITEVYTYIVKNQVFISLIYVERIGVLDLTVWLLITIVSYIDAVVHSI